MWHASAALYPRPLPLATRANTVAVLQMYAHAALNGVGAPELGQWREVGVSAVHLRRRLTPSEQAVTGDALDIRAMPNEVERRLAAVKKWLPPGWKE